ncbi:hypothetical protein GA0070611_5439 [Micromonospora auratinigra]|uniref:5-methylcytosine-specific restriction enzyme A n=1 Tax=Micromonospora auratinigra TaxID=261654 RepID=A0A1A9A734_9ACTN|nr:hypothetical protein GA0070611_5439 [Micromonospora auratinigra]
MGTGSRCPGCKSKPFANAQRKYAHNRSHPPEWYGTRARRMKAAFLAANPRCHECGAHSTHVDHATPVSVRPDLLMDVGNWRPHCGPCSERQGARIANARRYGRKP